MVALTAGLAGLLRRDGPWAEAITRHEAAIAAAGHLGDRLGQANALNDLGELRFGTGDFPPAARAHEQALGIYLDLGDRVGQASALLNLGVVRRVTGDYLAAAEVLEQALDIDRDLGDRVGEGNALTFLGDAWRATGDYPAAAQALEIYRDLGAPGGKVETLNEIGTLHRADGDLARAETYHRQALELARTIISPWDEAHALAGLGRCALAADRPSEGTANLRRALEIFQGLGAPEADNISRDLDALG